MKSASVKRIFAVLLSATMLFTAFQSVGFAASAAVAESSAWNVSVSVPTAVIPTNAAAAFEDAMKAYSGSTLVPLACYGEQVVAGINYYYICREGSDALKRVVVYKNTQDVSVVSSVSDFNLDDYAHNQSYPLYDRPADGATEVAGGLVACQLPADAEEVFNQVYAGISGSSHVPVAYLGKQLSSQTSYAYLCLDCAVVPDPDLYVDVVILNVSEDGTISSESVYSILGTRTNYSYDNGNLSYTFTGDDCNDAGYAQGTISLYADTSATYKVYWADNNGALEGYYPIGELSLKSGKTGTIDLGYHTAIPANATKIIATTTDSLSTSDAYSVYTIPDYKRLSFNSGKLLYTFSAYSDLHLDKRDGEVYWKNAETNLKNALQLSTEKEADYIVVSGDIPTCSNLDKEWDTYQKILSQSDYVNPVWESNGNHDLKAGVSEGLKKFIKATGTDGSTNSKSYFSVVEDKTGDIFIFMSLELSKDPNLEDVFSNDQINWVKSIIEDNYRTRNIFLVEHAPVKGFGAGDRMSKPYYGGLMDPSYTNNGKFKELLQKYKNIIFLSGHTHEDFSMNYNYSNENGEAANMIHTPALAGSTVPKNDSELEYSNGDSKSCQGYFVQVFENEIVFNGINVTDKLIFPTYSYIMEGARTSQSEVSYSQTEIPLSGTMVNATPTLEKAAYIFSNYYTYASYDRYQAIKKLYYKYKNESTLDKAIVNQFEDKFNSFSIYTGPINYHPAQDTYYFTNNKKWSSVYAYAWTGSSHNAEWPGVKLSKVATNSSGEDIYKVHFDTAGEYKNLIFNSGSNAAQTVDIALEGYENNGFYISGTSDGKFTVKNYSYTDGGGEEEQTHDDISMTYYVTDEHDWSDSKTPLTYSDGIYKMSYTAASTNSFSFSLYNGTANKYLTLSTSASYTYEEGQSFATQLEQASSRGKSVTIRGLSAGTKLDIDFNPKTNVVTVICPSNEPALENQSAISATDIALGEKVTITGRATGGTAPYTYTYEFQKSGKTTWTSFGSGTTAVFKPGAGTFTVRVTASDSKSKTSVKTFTVNCTAPLENASTVSATEIALGEKITISGKATGGTAPYTYKYEYQKAGKTTWTSFGSGKTALFKPGTGIFRIRVTITDSLGEAAVKEFKIGCGIKVEALANNSTVSATEIALGEKITISGKATGGAAPYTYKYEYQKAGKSTWTSFGSGTAAVFKPGSGIFRIRVTVTDSFGETAEKLFTIGCGVKVEELANNSTISSTSVVLGGKFTINGKASGGAAPYTYKYEYQKAGKSTWTSFGSGTAAVFKPGTGTFTIKVTVTDGIGQTQSKEFVVTVS